jgi:signal transduction histidine kinase
MLGEIFEYGYTTAEDGTGFDLSIVETTADAHGWSVEIDAEYEDGACFVFSDVVEQAEPAERADQVVSD